MIPVVIILCSFAPLVFIPATRNDMLKLLVVKIIGQVRVSCGKVKLFLKGATTYLTRVNLVFAIFSALKFMNLIITKLNLIDVRSTFDN